MNDATKIFELYLESKEEPIMNTRSNGTKEWRLHGKLHREGAPAIEYADGAKSWFINGKRHREDGPAIEWANGTKEWFINGKQYDDISAWAEAVLHHQKKPATQDDIDDKIAQVMQADLFD